MRPAGTPSRWVKVLPWYYTPRDLKWAKRSDRQRTRVALARLLLGGAS